MVRLYAHRGAAAELPENTLPSFQRALEVGADVLETDAHMTRDGKIVVAHDPTAHRMAGRPGEIRSCTLAEVKTWDVGWGYVQEHARPYASRGFVVPTLHELLEAFPNTPLNIDVKQRQPSMVGSILRVIAEHKAQDRVTLASFHFSTLRAIRAAGYLGATSLSQPEVAALLALPRAALRRFPIGQRAQLPTRALRLDLLQPWVRDKCQALGIALDYWTINDIATAKRALALGVSGIMTDDPRLIAPVVRGQ